MKVDSLRTLAMAKVPWKDIPDAKLRWGYLEDLYLEHQRTVHRRLLFSAFDEAFFHQGTQIDQVIRGAEWLMRTTRLQYRTLDTVTKLLASFDAGLSAHAAEIIASSSYYFWRHGSDPRLISSLLGQVSRSGLVEDDSRILFRWYNPYEADAARQGGVPIVLSIIRDLLVDPADIRSVVKGIAMIPPEVRMFYFWSHLRR